MPILVYLSSQVRVHLRRTKPVSNFAKCPDFKSDAILEIRYVLLDKYDYICAYYYDFQKLSKISKSRVHVRDTIWGYKTNFVKLENGFDMDTTNNK